MQVGRLLVYLAVALSIYAVAIPASGGIAPPADSSFWQILTLVSAACGFIFGVIFWAVRFLIKTVVSQFRMIVETRDESLKQAIGRIEKTNTEDRKVLLALERDLLTLKAELPEKYVRREEYIRTETNFHLKIDRLVDLLNKLQSMIPTGR